VNSKLTIIEAAALGGKNRSPKKLAAAAANLKKAQLARREKSRSKTPSALA
jgi:hypothetical protein